MKPRSVAVLFCAVLLPCLFGTPAWSQTEEAKPPGVLDLLPAREANCMVNLTWDPSVTPLGDNTLQLLAESSGVVGQAARELLGEAADHYDLESFPIGVWLQTVDSDFRRGTLLAKVEVTITGQAGKKASAREFMNAVCARLGTALEQLHNDNLRHLNLRLALATEEFARAEARLTEVQALRRQLLADAGRIDLSAERINEEFSELEEQQRALDMEVYSRKARQQALEERIAQVARKIEQRAGDDEMLVELARIVQLRERELDRIRSLVQKEMASATEADEVEERIARARAELYQARKEAVQEVGGDSLAEYNEELARTSLDAVELEARLKYITEKIERMRARKLLELADRFEKEVDILLPLARNALMMATSEREDIQRRLRTATPPTLTVIGREAKSGGKSRS